MVANAGRSLASRAAESNPKPVLPMAGNALNGTVSGLPRQLIDIIGTRASSVGSLDVPSGVDVTAGTRSVPL